MQQCALVHALVDACISLEVCRDDPRCVRGMRSPVSSSGQPPTPLHPASSQGGAPLHTGAYPQPPAPPPSQAPFAASRPSPLPGGRHAPHVRV